MIANKFVSAWWLNNSHLQTIFPVIFPRKINLNLIRERMELPDNDFLDLDWIGENKTHIVLVLHGLGGSIHSPYAQGIMNAIHSQGWTGVLMHFRGCSGHPNRLARSYHSGETEDLSFVITKIKKRFPYAQLAVVGYSLGGNVLLKWLGEKEINDLIQCAVAVSVPFELDKAVNHMNKGFSKIYQWWLLRKLKEDLFKKEKIVSLPIDTGLLKYFNNFRDFDQNITAPLHDFSGASEYYQHSSSRQYLKKIQVPTLIINSLDDPFIPCDAIPDNNELSNRITLELTNQGGHVGFVSGPIPIKPEYWLESRIPDYLKSLFA